MKKIRIAVIGTGPTAIEHLKAYACLKNKVEIVGISDTDLSQGKKQAKQAQTPFFSDFRLLLPLVDAVDICTKAADHFKPAHFFLDHGIHVFIERPMTLSVSDAEQLIHISRFKNAKIQVGYPERFNSAFMAIEKIAQNPLLIDCQRLTTCPTRVDDVGAVLELMTHDINIIQGLIHAPLQQIQATGANVLSDTEDIVSARLTFENKTVATLTVSRISPDETHKIHIALKNTYIALNYLTQEAFLCQNKNGKIIQKKISIEKNEPIKKELEHFIDCIREDKRPLISGEEGRDALKTALAIQETVWTQLSARS